MADELDRSADLIERLLGDPELRASFRADPATVLRDSGLAPMAEGLPGGRRAMLTLELRESRSSLAGVIVAAAAEGVDFTHVAEHAMPKLGHEAAQLFSRLTRKLSHHGHPKPTPAPPPPAAPRPAPAPAPNLGPSAAQLPAMARPPAPVHHHPVPVPAPAPAHQPVGAHHHQGAEAILQTAQPATDPLVYPGDSASSQQLAAWMGANAQQAGLPPELPVMAALTESGLRNLNYGDRDSVGFFQMRVGIWDEGPYAGYPSDPQLQIKWFIDHALQARQSDPALAGSPSSYGEWVADVERPAAEYRYRYQLRLSEAQALLRGANLGAPTGGAAVTAVGAGATGAGHEAVHHSDHHEPLGRGVSTTATACVGAKCTLGGGDFHNGFDGAGLVRYAYGTHGIHLPAVPSELFDVGATVPRDSLRPGDAVFFGASDGTVREVGLYVGDGKVIVATSQSHAVSIGSLTDSDQHYLGARRYSSKLLTGAASYARTLPTIKP